MSDDKYSHLGLALVAVMVALGTFAAGFFNGQSVTDASQTAAVINAAGPNGGSAQLTFRPEEIRALRELLARFNINRPSEKDGNNNEVRPMPPVANTCVQGIRTKYESQRKALMDQVQTLDKQIKNEVMTQCGVAVEAETTSVTTPTVDTAVN